MPNPIPLKLPPGMFRNGTKYQSQGRWYDGDLVRWADGILQPIGGWEKVELTDSVAVSAAIADDGGAFTDETTDANDAGADDVQLLPVAPASDDAFYVGYSTPFKEVEIAMGVAATDGAVTWEYYNGSAWVALSGVTDNTDSFKAVAGSTYSLLFTEPSDWAATTVNSQGPFFYVRARVTTVGTSQAQADQMWIATRAIAVAEPIRGLYAWKSNDGKSRFAFGTADKVYAFVSGSLTDITPAGIDGEESAVLSSGFYGDGSYGQDSYGVGDAAVSTLTEAQVWQLDNWGQELVGLAYSDGKLYSWDLNPVNDFVQMPNSPTDSLGIVVTPERFVVSLGGNRGGGADARQVLWSDFEDYSDWVPTAINQAGAFILPTTGSLMTGRRGRSETLIWTDADIWAMRWTGGNQIYGFKQLASGCGIISRSAVSMVSGRAFWMGKRGFFMYDGTVRPLPSEVSDYVFEDMNKSQRSKITSGVIARYTEVWWFYPSAGSEENDRYVVLNYGDGTWYFGSLQRTSMFDESGSFDYPLAADAESGAIYKMETGDVYLDVDDAAVLAPYAESGPVELGNGKNVYDIVSIIPDEQSQGDVSIKLFTSYYPNQDETESGPFTPANPTDVRASGRWSRLRVDHVNADWRVGIMRLLVELAGER